MPIWLKRESSGDGGPKRRASTNFKIEKLKSREQGGKRGSIQIVVEFRVGGIGIHV